MAAPKFKDLSSGTLAESISASTTTLLVYVGDGSASTIVSVWPSTPFYASIMPSSPSAGVANSLDSEIVKVTAVSTDQVGNTALTVVRAQRGTTGKAFDAGSIVTGGIYAEDAVIYDDVTTAVTPEPWIDTEDIKDDAVTADKIDFTTLSILTGSTTSIQLGAGKWLVIASLNVLTSVDSGSFDTTIAWLNKSSLFQGYRVSGQNRNQGEFTFINVLEPTTTTTYSPARVSGSQVDFYSGQWVAIKIGGYTGN